MTTYVSFTPTKLAPFQTIVTLDSANYTLVVTWNTGGQRWFCNLYDQSNVLIVCLPLIGSPPDYDISLTAGYFTSTLVYRQATGSFEINP